MTAELTFHTFVPPESPYPENTYRAIAALTLGNETLHSTGIDPDALAHIGNVTVRVPMLFAARIRDCFDELYCRERDTGHSCHVGAAALAGGGRLSLLAAQLEAADVIENGVPTVGPAVGIQGVIGRILNHRAIPRHSVVGIAPGIGLQVEDSHGPFSLVNHRAVLDYYRNATGEPDLKLYSRVVPMFASVLSGIPLDPR